MDKYANVVREYEKNKELKREDVENIKIWLEKQPHLPEMSELQIILFLQSCYFSSEQAKRAIEIFFTMRTLCKEIFRNGNVEDRGIKMALEVALISVLPKPDKNGQKLIFMRLVDTNVDKYFFVDHLRMFDMIITLHMHLEGTNEGVNLVFDLEGVNFSHLVRLSPVLAHKYVYYLQDALPVKVKGIYLANAPSWTDKGLAFFKPFLRKDLFESIKVFTDLESLFEVFPRELFPKDYGGAVSDTVEDLREKNIRMFREHEDFFKSQEKQLNDESKRLEKSEDYNNIFGLDGTFRKLELD